jgi:CubicO group peptidase (beta-lactamase class C family)
VSRQLSIAPGYESVAKVFGKYHKDELAGASFAATVNGTQVVDLWGGIKSDGTTWDDDTLCVIASGTKGICTVAVLMCVDRGLINLESPIESVWPEFAAGGKGHVLIGDALAHMAGVPGIEREITAEEIADPILMAQLVAQQHPFVPIGSPTYHALTFGWIASELVRRVDGRSIGTFVREEIAQPLQLDLHIGAAENVLPRIALTTRAKNYNYTALLPESTMDPRLVHVYGMAQVEFEESTDYAKIELPGGGGVANAYAMSRLYAMLVNGGELDGVRLLQPETIEIARRERSVGNDALSGRELRFGIGFEINPNPSRLGMAPDAFGHTGAGGSTHGAWPSMKTSFSYAMGEFQTENSDSRAFELLDVLDECVMRQSKKK